MCSFVPQSLFQNLLEKGNEEEKQYAKDALQYIKDFFYDPQAILERYLEGLKASKNKREAEEEAPNRSIYDAENKMSLPGKLVRQEGEAAGKDTAVNEAYDGSGKTFDLFFNVFGRNSIDDAGMELISTVHYGRNFGNAFWNGTSMTYGDGDGKIFKRFTLLDVIAHETAHGVTERTAGLKYYKQSGALNEHFSDVFGSLVKQYSMQQTADKADWLIGEGLFTDRVDARALRDMKNPGTAYNDPVIGKDPQPDHFKDYKDIDHDNGGVHIFSGIPNKAFCLTALNIGGPSWSRAGLIWYNTLTKELKPNSQFKDAVKATVKVAEQLYGGNSIELKAVVDGWKQVGL